ncbi:DUF4352 domain-containing protein [Actinomadura sp. 1N219]|uniref:DUF4352 domain-containing protein n=1 Tax=Actinomadura sp. 1N219 TaxID=3375152 RepID=UPI0037B4B4AA
MHTSRITVAGVALIAALTGACGPVDTASEPSNEDPAEKSPVAAKMGEAAKDGKFTFVVTDVSTRTESIGDEFVGREPQGKFVMVDVKVTNHATEAQGFLGSDQKLLASGNTYSADDEAAAYLPSSQSLYEQINPGNKVSGVVIFDVPRKVKPTAIELHDSAFSNGVRVDLK